MPLAAAVPAIIGGVSSIGGALIGSHAAGAAAAQQAAAAAKVAQMAQDATQKGQAGIATAQGGITGATGAITNNLQPYLQAGQTGIGMLNSAVAPGGSLAGQFTFDPSQLAQNPAYQFQLQQGLLALDRSAAARGTSNTGGTLKAIQDYAQSLAGTTYNNAFNQSLTQFQTNRNAALQNIQTLLGLGTNGTSMFNQAQQWGAGTNLQAAESSGQMGLQGAQIAGNAITGGANAQAAGTVGAANAWNSGLAGLSNAAQGYQLNQTLNGLYNASLPDLTPTLTSGVQGITPSLPPATGGPVPAAPLVSAPPVNYGSGAGMLATAPSSAGYLPLQGGYIPTGSAGGV